MDVILGQFRSSLLLCGTFPRYISGASAVNPTKSSNLRRLVIAFQTVFIITMLSYIAFRLSPSVLPKLGTSYLLQLAGSTTITYW